MTIDINQITLTNPIVIDRITKHGHCIVSDEYVRMCSRESTELAKIKAENAKIVHCKDCQNHGQCSIEEIFNEIKLDEKRRYCGIGKKGE